MSAPRQKAIPQGNAQRAAELLGFLLVSALGIFALGNGLTGLFEAGKAINLLWLAVSLTTMMVLWAQMRRVKDSWPRRPATKTVQGRQAPDSEMARSTVPVEER